MAKIYISEKQINVLKNKQEEKDTYKIGSDGSMGYSHIIQEGYDISEIGEFVYDMDFDQDDYEEWLIDSNIQNNPNALSEYIKDNVQFNIELMDNETFHSMGYKRMYYDEIENEYGEKLANIILQDCIRDGEGRIETLMLCDDEININNPEEVNKLATKVLPHGSYTKNTRGFILTNGEIIYTEAEHNECSRINGIKGTFHFISLGNIRLLDHSIDLGKEPTKEQADVLRKVISCYSDEYLYMDLIKNGSEHGCQYIKPNWREVLNDIRRFYKEGIKPTGGHGHMFGENKNITENFVDETDAPDETQGIKWSVENAYPFLHIDNKLIIGKPNEMHEDVILRIFAEQYGFTEKEFYDIIRYGYGMKGYCISAGKLKEFEEVLEKYYPKRLYEELHKHIGLCGRIWVNNPNGETYLSVWLKRFSNRGATNRDVPKISNLSELEVKQIKNVFDKFNCDLTKSYVCVGDDKVNILELLKGLQTESNHNVIFPNSKVRNSDGTLKVMYRGDKNDIDVFDRQYSNSSNLYGTGFYFTDSEYHAQIYGNTIKYYLNIEHPLNTDIRTITKDEVLKFLYAVNENEDYGLYNYGYGSTPEKVLKMVYEDDRSDFSIIQDINAACIGDMVEATLLFNKINNTTFDGFILDTETVVFDNSQIKKVGENISESKEQQLKIILNNNPMLDDYHTGIRTIDDIHTFNEFQDKQEEWISDPSWTETDILKAFTLPQIKVYSSYPIKQGVFVTPSKMCAQDYAGEGKIYSKTVNKDDVAWIDVYEGQYAPISIQENLEYEVKPSEVDTTSFIEKDTLCPQLWENGVLNPKVRLKLLDIADDFYKTLDINWVKPIDIILTGSICNFNWSTYSDIDLHIIIDYQEVSEKTDFVQTFFDSKKNEWNEQHNNLEMYGFKVELYVQDVTEDAVSSGVYSLEQNKWLNKPSYNEMSTDNIDFEFVKEKASAVMTYIDDIIERFNSTKDKYQLGKIQDEIDKLTKKLKKIRTNALDKNGEISVGNIVYKILRRTEYLDKIWKIHDAIYDKVNSINENIRYCAINEVDKTKLPSNIKFYADEDWADNKKKKRYNLHKPRYTKRSN